MEKEIVSGLSDEALASELARLRSRYMHFQAAERSWNLEQAERELCSSDLYLVHNECVQRGISVEKGRG